MKPLFLLQYRILRSAWKEERRYVVFIESHQRSINKNQCETEGIASVSLPRTILWLSFHVYDGSPFFLGLSQYSLRFDCTYTRRDNESRLFPKMMYFQNFAKPLKNVIETSGFL